jgi:anti-sigma factor RsiW
VTCRETVDLLGDYVDGDLPGEMRREVDAHLAGCPECTTYLATYRTTISLAKGALGPGPRKP